jgi:hypothetical protein
VTPRLLLTTSDELLRLATLGSRPIVVQLDDGTRVGGTLAEWMLAWTTEAQQRRRRNKRRRARRAVQRSR